MDRDRFVGTCRHHMARGEDTLAGEQLVRDDANGLDADSRVDEEIPAAAFKAAHDLRGSILEGRD